MNWRTVHEVVSERFWAKVKRTPDCWIWQGGTNPFGYGFFGTDVVSGYRRGEHAHRVAYWLYYGDFDTSLFVCHTCDNPSCVRPDHLFLGTNAENMKDMKKKGRAVSPRSLWTHCAKGHALTGDNLIIQKKTGYRRCRTCTRKRARSEKAREYHREWRAKNRERSRKYGRDYYWRQKKKKIQDDA